MAGIIGDPHGQDIRRRDQSLQQPVELGFEEASRPAVTANRSQEGIHHGCRLLLDRFLNKLPLLSPAPILPDTESETDADQHNTHDLTRPLHVATCPPRESVQREILHSTFPRNDGLFLTSGLSSRPC